jgi:hypothetical protein
MLTLLHIVTGALVILSNAIAALWLFALDRRALTLTSAAQIALWAGRATLMLQLLLGLALVGSGYVGVTLHYFLAFAAAAALYWAALAARRAVRPLRTLAFGSAFAALAALVAYLVR